MGFLSYQVIFLPFRLVQGLPSEVQRSRGKITLSFPVRLFWRGQPMKWGFEISAWIVLIPLFWSLNSALCTVPFQDEWNDQHSSWTMLVNRNRAGKSRSMKKWLCLQVNNCWSHHFNWFLIPFPTRCAHFCTFSKDSLELKQYKQLVWGLSS